MALRNIILKGDRVLYKTSRPVTDFNARLRQLIDDMRETLENANGLGLAAPQVGVLRRVVLVEDAEGQMIELINPVILEQTGEVENVEGCLSLPGKYGLVKRPAHVKVKAQDRGGEWFEVEGDDYVARCFCHEIEHLDGHLFDERCARFLTEEELAELRKSDEEAEEAQAGE